MKISKTYIRLAIIVIIFFVPSLVSAADTDNDGLDDELEVSFYYTSPDNADTDGDGYSDGVEIATGFSPHRPEYRLSQLDWDKDGLNDEAELFFAADLQSSDTDGDGYTDFEEVDTGFSPTDPAASAKLVPSIELDLKNQTLHYMVGGYRWKSFPASTGKPSMPTPTGEYRVINKIDKAWSKAYGLWMPYWMGLGTGRFGIHELPIWPGGYREGEDHLGKAVSHGCIRLGIGPAAYVYSRISVGDKVVIR